MTMRRLISFLFVVWAALIVVACAADTPQSEPTTEATDEPQVDHTDAPATEDPTQVLEPTEDEVVVYEPDMENLQPCGAFHEMRLLETPMPAPTSATPVTPPPTPTLDVRPAPSEDHLGFPENWETDYKLLFVFDRPDRRISRAICANDIALQRKPGEPFPYGSVLLMVSYAAKIDNGQLVLDENGHYIRTRMTTLHMMVKEEGYGEAYSDLQAGEWEFVGYLSDGSYEVRPENTAFCSACHLNDGGESIDYVFRMNMFEEGETAHHAPEVGENEISIYLYSFHQPELEVMAGTTVTWINDDQASHTIMAAVQDDKGVIIPDPNQLFASSVLPSTTIQAGSSFSFTFDEPGEYLYICTLHKNMVGKIIVTE